MAIAITWSNCRGNCPFSSKRAGQAQGIAPTHPLSPTGERVTLGTGQPPGIALAMRPALGTVIAARRHRATVTHHRANPSQGKRKALPLPIHYRPPANGSHWAQGNRQGLPWPCVPRWARSSPPAATGPPSPIIVPTRHRASARHCPYPSIIAHRRTGHTGHRATARDCPGHASRVGHGHRWRTGQAQGIAPTHPIQSPIIEGTAVGQPSRIGTMRDAAGRSHGRDDAGRDGRGKRQDEWLGAIPRGCPC